MKIQSIVPSEKAKAYFARINFKFDPTLSEEEFLNRLQYAHVTSVPYENLDILNKIPLKFDTDSLFDKVVTRKRGGYCYELNGIFGWLLRDLGFEVHDYMGRYLRGEEGIPMRRHRVLRVVGESGEYICDVGIANTAPRYPLKLVESVVQEQFGERYVIEKEPFFGYVIYLVSENGERERFYSFTGEEQLDIDFVAPSFYLENSPDSKFNKKEMVAVKTENGRKVIDGKIFKIYDGKQIDIPIASDRMMADILEIHYGIKL